MKKGLEKTLDRNLPVPLYYQIAQHLNDKIRSGHLVPGAQLPSERDLSLLYGVSRMTARQTISYLVNEGVLVVRHGQGTFVAEPKLTYDAPHLMGFTETMLREGKTATSTVIEQGLIEPPPYVSQCLDLAPNEWAIKIVRVRQIETTPLVLETIFVPTSLCPGLETLDLSVTSLYSILEQHYGLTLDHASETLAAHTASDYEQQILQVSRDSPVITLEGITFLASEQPVEFFIAHYRADRFKFSFESRRGTFNAKERLFEMMLDNERLSTT
jgi:GntR family transcriptional regulator